MKTSRPFEVFETTDYSMFKKIDYNRSVSRSNVKKIMKSIIEYGLIVPIVISEDGYIIDGQHRLEALIALDMSRLVCGVAKRKRRHRAGGKWCKEKLDIKGLGRLLCRKRKRKLPTFTSVIRNLGRNISA